MRWLVVILLLVLLLIVDQTRFRGYYLGHVERIVRKISP